MSNEIIVLPIEGNATKYLQEIINNAAKNKKDLFISKGVYNIGPIFLDNDLSLFFEDGVIFRALTDENEYIDIQTRIAGIEMNWYPAIVNIIDKKNVSLNGHLVIDGNGQYWWDKYWGFDTLGGMRKAYDAKGLRWACDYDCKRPRNLLIQNSSEITINGIESYNSGFWNIHILYSKYVNLNNVYINSDAINSPSTDGIDIDSSNNITVTNCVTNCNDDSICIKSGRDTDGIRVGKPSYDVTIKDCVINNGFGITIGSEVSGGIYDVLIDNIMFNGTDCGFRIKSSEPRRGYIKNITFRNIKMTDVKYLFHFNLDWNRGYSFCELPSNYKGEIKDYYYKLIEKAPSEIPLTKVSNILIENVFSTNDILYQGISRIFNLTGYEKQPISSVTFKNINVYAREYGIIEYVEDINFENFKFTVIGSNDSTNDSYDNR